MRNLIAKFNMDRPRRSSANRKIHCHFPEAWVEDFEPLINAMTKDPKDRHVLAAAVRSHSELIVTYNRRDFPKSSVEQFDIEVQGPSTFLRGLYDLEPGLTVHKVHEQAKAIGITFQRLLLSLSKNAPGFVQYFCEEQGISLPSEQASSPQ